MTETRKKTAAAKEPATVKKTAAGKKAPAAKKSASPKRQKVFFSRDDAYYFGQSVHYEVYKKLGAHPSTEDGKDGYFFAVWAPHAKSVSVIGEFNGWDTEADHMEIRSQGISDV